MCNFCVQSWQFVKTLLLHTSHVLHTELSLHMSLCGCYIWWSSCHHMLYHLSSAFWLHECWVKCCPLILVIRGGKILKTYRRILPQYGENCSTQRKLNHFHCGRTSAIEEVGCLMTSWMVECWNKLKVLVEENRWITVTSIASKLGIIFWSAYSIFHDSRRYYKLVH